MGFDNTRLHPVFYYFASFIRSDLLTMDYASNQQYENYIPSIFLIDIVYGQPH